MQILKPAPYFLIIFLFFLLSSCKNNAEYFDENDYQQIEKIDAHVHYHSNNPAFIDEAIKDNFRLVSVNVNWDFFGKVNQQQDYVQALMKDYPGEIDYITTFNLEGWENNKEWEKKTISYIDSSLTKGAIAVKFWKNIGLELKDSNGTFVMVDDPRFEPIFKHLEERNIPVLAHIGEPKNCWLPLDKMTVGGDKKFFTDHPEHHMFLHPEFPKYEQLVASRDNILKRYPKLKVIGAHLGSLEWSVDELAQRLDAYPNFAVDLAERIIHLQYQSLKDWQKIHDFVVKYQDRILYASDRVNDGKEDAETFKKKIHATWTEDWKYFTTEQIMRVEGIEGEVKGLRLPRSVVEKIFRENAKKWYPRLAKDLDK